MSYPNIIFASFSTQEHTANTANRFHTLGQRMDYEDGRKFRYILVGGVTLLAGSLNQGKVFVAADSLLAVQAAWAVGATSGTVSTASTTAADFYNGGWVGTNKDPGGGYTYKVKDHPIFLNTGTVTITLEPDSPIAIALTTSSEFSFAPNPYNGVVVCPVTTVTAPIVGVTAAPVTNAQFGWVQTGGVAMVESATSCILGNNAAAALSAEGEGAAPNATDIDEVIGIVWTIATTQAEFSMIDLKLE